MKWFLALCLLALAQAQSMDIEATEDVIEAKEETMEARTLDTDLKEVETNEKEVTANPPMKYKYIMYPMPLPYHRFNGYPKRNVGSMVNTGLNSAKWGWYPNRFMPYTYRGFEPMESELEEFQPEEFEPEPRILGMIAGYAAKAGMKGAKWAGKKALKYAMSGMFGRSGFEPELMEFEPEEFQPEEFEPEPRSIWDVMAGYKGAKWAAKKVFGRSGFEPEPMVVPAPMQYPYYYY